MKDMGNVKANEIWEKNIPHLRKLTEHDSRYVHYKILLKILLQYCSRLIH
jgi:hypothetical protein